MSTSMSTSIRSTARALVISGLGVILGAGLGAGLGACSDPAQEDAYLQISYEAIPGGGVVLPQGTVDASASDYAEKLAFTEDVFSVLVPQIMEGVGVDPARVTSEITPGGFLLETNPSMQSRMETPYLDDLDGPDDPGGTADRLAAALGYTMYQWSVLVTDFAAESGNTGYLTVRFTEVTLDADLAQRFFEHAATVDSGLGGGYTAFDNDMIFLNVRDDTGAPYSGLDDETFFAALEMAASTFTTTEVVFLESGFVDARFVGNDWEGSPAGQEYLATVGPESDAWLNPLQASFAQMVDDAATMYGWTVTPQALRAAEARLGIRRGHWQALTMLGTLPTP